MKSIIVKLFITFFLLAELPFSLVSAQTVNINMSSQEKVTVVKAEGCVIALGDKSCIPSIVVNSYPGRNLVVTYTNSDYQDFPFPGKRETKQSGFFRPASGGEYTLGGAVTMKVTTPGNLRETWGGNLITYGQNKIDIYENDKLVGTTYVTARCADGSLWTGISTGNFGELDQTRCLAPISGQSGNTQVLKADGLSNLDPNFGLVRGYCLPGEKWQFDQIIKGLNNSSATVYGCKPNVDPVDINQIKFTISAKTPIGLDVNSAMSNCEFPVAYNNISNQTCLGSFSLDAPQGRTFSVYSVGGGPLSSRTSSSLKEKGFYRDITEYTYTDRRYVYDSRMFGQIGLGEKNPLTVDLSYTEPNIFELRLGSTTVATVTAKATASSNLVDCGFNDSDANGVKIPTVACRTHIWDIKTIYGNSSTPVTQITPFNTTLPSGCTSSTTFSPTTGQRCTTTTTNATQTITGSSSLSPTNLTVTKISPSLKGLLLTWTAPSASIARYKVSTVEYNTQGVAGQKKLVAYLVPTAKDYVISPLQTGLRYDVYISAVDTNGNESPESSVTGVSLSSSTTTTTGDIDPQGTTGTLCSSITTDLRQGSRNDAVYALQDFLISKGYLNAEATGYFGVLTFKAVQSYQNDQGLTPSGFVGPLTRGAIQAECRG